MKKQGVAFGLTVALAAGCTPGEQGPSLPTPEASLAPGGAVTTWTGVEPGFFPFPGRVKLPVATCEQWRADNPQPGKIANGVLYVVIDARNNRRRNCDPEADSGAGRESGASTESPNSPGPNGEPFSEDGTVVQVLRAEIGQLACNHDGTSASDLWLEVDDGISKGTESFMVSATNVGFVDPTQLKAVDITPTFGPYKDTSQGGC